MPCLCCLQPVLTAGQAKPSIRYCNIQSIRGKHDFTSDIETRSHSSGYRTGPFSDLFYRRFWRHGFSDAPCHPSRHGSYSGIYLSASPENERGTDRESPVATSGSCADMRSFLVGLVSGVRYRLLPGTHQIYRPCKRQGSLGFHRGGTSGSGGDAACGRSASGHGFRLLSGLRHAGPASARHTET